jgi:predicted anti-sigma-YlaC factor YlaD
MTCELVAEKLDEYVDGDLDEATFQEMELHLGGCAECRQQEKELRALVAEAAALPREIEPGRDLWPELAERLRGAEGMRLVGRPAARVLSPVALAAAASVVLALSAGLWVRSRHAPDATPGAPGQGTLQPVAAVSVAPGAELLEAEREYARATADLMAAIDSRKDSLTPETREVLDANLKTIDEALAQVRAALRRDPGNGALTHLLTSTHQKKLDALQRVVRLNRT